MDNKNIDIVSRVVMSEDDIKSRTQLRQTKKKSSSNAWFIILLFIVLLAAVGAGAWQLLEQQQKIINLNKQIGFMENHLSQVMDDLSGTNQSVNNKNTSMSSKLQILNESLTKINKRNKKWIIINKENIVKLNKRTLNWKQTEQSVDELKQTVSDISDQAKVIANEQSLAISSLSRKNEQANQVIFELQQTIHQLVVSNKKVISQSNEYQHSIKVLNLFRIEANKKINQLENTLRVYIKKLGK